MFEGTVIETEADAAAFDRAIRANPGVWSPRDMDPRPVEVGEAFNLPPCVGSNWPLRTEDRPCPHVELWPENGHAGRLVFAALPEHTRQLLPAYIEALAADLEPADARVMVSRAIRALQSPAVASWLRAAVRGDASS